MGVYFRIHLRGTRWLTRAAILCIMQGMNLAIVYATIMHRTNMWVYMRTRITTNYHVIIISLYKQASGEANSNIDIWYNLYVFAM